MNAIVIGSIVTVNDDTYEDNRYQVLNIEGSKAEIQLIAPSEKVSWGDLDNLAFCQQTREEAVANWRRGYGYSGI
jgi:hypothetical protein